MVAEIFDGVFRQRLPVPGTIGEDQIVVRHGGRLFQPHDRLALGSDLTQQIAGRTFVLAPVDPDRVADRRQNRLPSFFVNQHARPRIPSLILMNLQLSSLRSTFFLRDTGTARK